MSKIGAHKLHRLLASMLALVLMLTAVPASALGLAGWENVTVSVIWTDAAGNLWEAPAVSIPEEYQVQYGWWVTLPQEALGTTVSLQILHEDPAYTYWLNDFTLQLYWTAEKDAQDLDDLYAQYVGYSYNGAPQISQMHDCMKLYLSTGQPPFEVPAGEGGSADAVLPEVETIVPGDVELITPVTPSEPEIVPVQAVIPVYYRYENGEIIDMTETVLGEGVHTLWPESTKVGGLELLGSYSATVTVYPDGSADVASVTFTYREPYVAPVEANVDVLYVHEDGWLIDQQSKTLGEGTYTIRPESSLVGSYELTSDSAVTVTVDVNGYTSMASVSFYYKDVYVAPAQAVVPVYYYHEDGRLLDVIEKTLTEGTHTIVPESSRVGGYELASDSAVTVNVDANGYTSAASVSFYYQDVYVAPAQAVVPVYYYHQDGQLLDVTEKTLTEGTHTIVPESSRVSGLELISEASVTVTVGADGSASITNALFLYRNPDAAPVTGEATVIYQMENGKLIDQRIITLAQGEQTVRPESQKVSGLELVSDSSVSVYIDGGGAVSPNPVVFTYREPQAAQASFTAEYYDSMGVKIATDTPWTLSPGTYWIKPEPIDLPAGYELISDEAIEVTVYSDGTYSPKEISFWYRPVQSEPEYVTPVLPEASASVIVRYLDSRGKAIASEQTVTLVSGANVVAPDPANIPAGYEIFPGTASTVTVTVSGGKPNQEYVNFYFAQSKQTAAIYPVTVYYYDSQGNQIASPQTKQLTPGTHLIEAQPVGLPEGYELISEAIFTLTVSENGALDRPAEDVGFWYRPVQTTPCNATISVQYVDSDGRIVAGPYLEELQGGQSYTLYPEASLVPEGYDSASAQAVKVTVSQEGYAQPSTVVFSLTLATDSTVIPAGQEIARYGLVNGVDVAFRTEPMTSGGNKTVISRAKKGSSVYMISSEYNDKGELWTKVLINGREGYMQTKFIDMLTQKASDVYAQSVGATPVPTSTPVPTPTPTEVFVEALTPVPTTAAPYAGYALTIAYASLRTGMNAADLTIQSLDIGELVHVKSQLLDVSSGTTWSIVQTLNGQSGYVETAKLQPISEQEAAQLIRIWQQQNATPVPTVLVTNTPEPEQQQGYAYTITDYVPFRQMANEQSSITATLRAGTVVYIAGQDYFNGSVWHSAVVNGEWGYIREELVRFMTSAEEDAYLSSLFATPTPTIATTNRPYDEEGMSSYGYVDASSVNFRDGASKQARKIGELRQYALCLIIGTEYTDGVTWYKVDYSGTQGYVHGDYFYHMTLRELTNFLSSDMYRQGISNNNGSSQSDDDDVTGIGGLPSVEDQLVGNDDFLFEYEEFVSPVTPIPNINPTNTPTLEPIILPGSVNTPEPTDRIVSSGGVGMDDVSSDLAMPDATTGVTYPAPDQSGSGNGIVWIIVIALLLVAGGGVFVFVQHQRKRRRIALRAAQRRAQAARSAQNSRAYAAAAQQQNRTGMYQQPSNAQRPYQASFPQNQNARSTVQPGQQGYPSYGVDAASAQRGSVSVDRPYARRTGDAAQPQTTETTRRVGRRTAYQQALAEQQRKNDQERTE